MNEYTRREEVRWTLVASAVLLLAVAIAVALLVTAKGRVVPDQAAIGAAKAAEGRAKDQHACVVVAKNLATEVDLFRETAKTARLEQPDAGTKKKPKAKDAPDVELAWTSAQPSSKLAKQLLPCRAPTEAAAGQKADATPVWDAVGQAAALTPPGDDDKAGQVAATRKLLALLGDAKVAAVVDHTTQGEAALKEQADKLAKAAESATVREPLPSGLFPRETAIGVGVGICVLALLISYVSVRAASRRRLGMLVPLRDVATTPQRGLQAAAILRLAAQHNGGEPGMVVGAAFGGLFAALAFPLDTDLFVAGVMAGLLLGLGAQWGMRLAMGVGTWRRRAAELGEVEKPTIPIVLVLSGVNQGMEESFLKFFHTLAPQDAAATVDKLAAQAEERILAAAEAGAAAQAAHAAAQALQAQQQQQQPPPPQNPGWPMPPR